MYNTQIVLRVDDDAVQTLDTLATRLLPHMAVGYKADYKANRTTAVRVAIELLDRVIREIDTDRLPLQAQNLSEVATQLIRMAGDPTYRKEKGDGG